MRKVILCLAIVLIFVSLAMAAEEGELYGITLIFGEDKMSISSVDIVEGFVPETVDEGQYTLRVVGFSDELLFETRFDFNPGVSFSAPPTWFDEEGNQIYIPDTSPPVINVSKILFVPYFVNGAEVEILEFDVIITSFDISEFAVCNQNGECESGETLEICPDDCVLEGEVGILDEEDVGGELEVVHGNWIYLIVGIVIFLVLAVCFLIFWIKRKRSARNR